MHLPIGNSALLTYSLIRYLQSLRRSSTFSPFCRHPLHHRTEQVDPNRFNHFRALGHLCRWVGSTSSRASLGRWFLG
ncbi:unnamed protein product [Protopolystoma xenopodis]|uniref:Uncharacterized protein n=1 Tax=Protopolystoma xenopodis TaxID=117903 RepID=A0A448XPU6_9PLAT|nr:unnamed protein product [Protopolystoma xenopodis]